MPYPALRCRLLYVTPNIGDYRLLVSILNGEPTFNIEHAELGQSALEILRSREPLERSNLIVTVWQLDARMTGRELITELKADNNLKMIPVIVFSSQLPPGEVENIYDAGAACVVEMPNDLDALTTTIKTLKNFWVHQAQLPFCFEAPVRSASAGDSR